MLIEAMAFPRQGLSSAGVQPKPGRGQEAEGVRFWFKVGPQGGDSWGPSPHPSSLCWSIRTAKPWQLLLPAKKSSGGQPAKADKGV